MPVVVAHDYVTQKGGAERVALHMLRGLDADHLVTSVHDEESTFPEFSAHRIQTSRLQRVPAFRRDPRLAFPVLAPTWSAFPPVEADALVCSSSGWSHGLRTAPGTRKIVYCHNTARWLWQPADYRRGLGRAGRASLVALAPALKRWDLRQAGSADQYLANSQVVHKRIRAVYGIDAPVLPPPVGLLAEGEVTPVPGLDPGFVVTIARDRGYKRVDAVLDAFRAAPDRTLAVVGGSAPEGVEPEPNIHYLGRVSDAQLRWLYASASALVSASSEDFGLTPLEANQFGTPAVAIRGGGFLETIRVGRNGTFFDDLTPEAILGAIDAAGRLRTDDIMAVAAEYQPAAFLRRLEAYL
jgi:glycosyltransferase involved in cell wall biosynthesis